jgi:iron complex outermembrane receptor protein
VTLRGSVLPLRAALDTLSTIAEVRLTYASDLVPADRLVCVAIVDRTLGVVLATWLGGSAAPIVVGPNQIVLAPIRGTVDRVTQLEAPSAAQLAPVVVVADGSVTDADGAATGSRTVIRRRDLQRVGSFSLGNILDGVVPGLWIWNTGPAGMAATFGSFRGASSFGISVPKIYIDGIEVANPLLLARLNPEMLDEIEVIRGPEGAALYGSDAIGGVIKIRTRRPEADGAPVRLQLTTTAGIVGSASAPLGALSQEHVVSLQGGSSTRAYTATVSGGRIGAYAPGSFSRQFAAVAGANFLGRAARLALTGRLNTVRARSGWGELSGLPAVAETEPTAMTTYTIGSQLVVASGSTWSHTLVAGLDGYTLRDVWRSPLAYADVGDSALWAARGRGDRGTVRLTSVAQLGNPGRSATLTLGADHTLLRDGARNERTAPGADWRNALGMSAQVAVGLGEHWVANAGLRLEHSSGVIAQDLATPLPSLGVGYMRYLGPLAIKVRGAYGKAMRAPHIRGGGSASALLPEQQEGVEGGIDLSIGRDLTVQFTAFDQRAFGLVLPVDDDLSTYRASGFAIRAVTALQNAGAIDNRGWELQGTMSGGIWQVSGTVSHVDSRVARVAPGYAGDLRPGDRMLGVPRWTGSLQASWLGKGWNGGLGVTRAADWLNYDWLALARDGAPSAGRRDYWTSYSGVTRLSAHASRALTRGLAMVFWGDNLLGTQRGEPDNLTIVPGRTLTAGIRARL